MTATILDTMTSRDLMTARVESLRPDQTIRDAASWLERKGYSGAPVVNCGDRLVGVLSEFDCIEAITQVLEGGSEKALVQDYMTRNVETVLESTPAAEVLAKFAEMSWRRLIVVDEERRVKGLIARRDLIRSLKSVAYHPSYEKIYDRLSALWR